jgi:hypothetical protein
MESVRGIGTGAGAARSPSRTAVHHLVIAKILSLRAAMEPAARVTIVLPSIKISGGGHVGSMASFGP